MLERDIESVLRTEVRKAGGIAIKLVPNPAGLPDRLVVWPDGEFDFVELKTDTGRLRKVQATMFIRLARLGHSVTILHGPEQVRSWARERSC